MLAPVFKGVGKPLQVETLPDPMPQAGDLVLRSHAAAFAARICT